MASHFLPTTRIRLASPCPNPILSAPSSVGASLSTSFLSPFVGGSVLGNFSGHKIRPISLNPYSSTSRAKRGVVTMVIPFSRGSAWEQPPPDLASYLYKNRIVYLGMSLVPSVTELILAEFLYLQYEDEEKPIYLYINSTGTTKGGEKLGYETEAFAIYDVMRYVKPPIFTLCVGNAWGEAALLLAAGAKGNRSALPSSTIMIKQPIARFQGQASDVELMRKEVKNVKAELVTNNRLGLCFPLLSPMFSCCRKSKRMSVLCAHCCMLLTNCIYACVHVKESSSVTLVSIGSCIAK
ncbi:ATP-dependent Clp protease proteolytic subunit-related protein 4, chloroplastic-like isoform X1 [Olea europaea var. sylvestris]|uniref:ATP-dependent Clp protease proteolytic subunit-related protein 4, chloroplastic-like isoform X1 n=1 Tax=Olea europaea var. sylvestris TaxID=158386 RepID=UPI000C1D2E59|nr:ATP-dependent Clp protease proteolytic subunit-related protein 4, chloroplastic-like isoform X1 [Olea europaea var. sylvestris]